MNAGPPRSWSQPLATLEAPPSIPGWTLLRILGGGAHGTVWLARRQLDGLSAAIKVVRGAAASRGEATLLRELEVLAALSHPGVIELLDHGRTADGRPFCAMELVAGPDLATVLRAGRMRIDRAWALARGMGEALAAAHARGIVHGDLKPANVVVRDDGRPVLLDFGLAVPATSAGVKGLRGSPAYVAPEQLDGAPPGTASDVHALGAILFEMATGRRAFDGDTIHQLLYRIAFQERTPPSALAAEVPAAIDAVVLRCLSRDPAARPSASEVVRATGEAVPVGDSID